MIVVKGLLYFPEQRLSLKVLYNLLKPSKGSSGARTRGSASFASRGLLFFWVFLYCWLLVSLGSRGPRRLPWSPVVSRPVVSRILLVVSLLSVPGIPGLPWSPVVPRGLPPRGRP